MVKIISLIAGGAVGTLARYGVSRLTHKIMGVQLPWGTFAVNILGCFLLGFFAMTHEEKFHFISPHARFMLMVGFCGAFTTFSTFMMETVDLMQSGQTVQAFLNVLVSVIVGFVLLKLGMMVGQVIS